MDKTAKGSQGKILELFRDGSGAYLSGEQISRALGVSRTAVWKQIGHLRSLGYGIEAATSRGYRLVTTPDALIPAEIRADLGTLRVGGEIVFWPKPIPPICGRTGWEKAGRPRGRW